MNFKHLIVLGAFLTDSVVSYPRMKPIVQVHKKIVHIKKKVHKTPASKPKKIIQKTVQKKPPKPPVIKKVVQQTVLEPKPVPKPVDFAEWEATQKKIQWIRAQRKILEETQKKLLASFLKTQLPLRPSYPSTVELAVLSKNQDEFVHNAILQNRFEKYQQQYIFQQFQQINLALQNYIHQENLLIQKGNELRKNQSF